MKLNDLYRPEKHYKVLVKTLTFNQSKYIQETLAGIAMQITNFPFVNIVLEDHSTDGEQEVIKSWMLRECDMSLAEYYDIPTAELIIAPHKTNEHCTLAVYFHKENLFNQKGRREAQIEPWRANSEYEALCEGDDYWIDPLKLQKQANNMDANPNIGLVHTAFNIVGEDGELLKDEEIPSFYRKLTPGKSKGYIYDKLFNNPSSILTCSVMYRIINYGPILDHDLFMQVAKKYEIDYIDSPMSCYRILSSSMMRARGDEVEQWLFKTISTHMLKYYQGDDSINVYYKQSSLRNEVDVFFSKYVTRCISQKQILEFPFLTILTIMLKNPRLFVTTPYNVLRRLLHSIVVH